MLEFEKLEVRHYEEIYHANTGNVAKYFFDFTNVNESKEWVQKTLAEVDRGEKFEFVVHDTKRFIWMIALRIHSNKVGEISLRVSEQYQKKWYWKKMINFILWEASKIKLHKIIYQVSKENIASIFLIRSFWFDQVNLSKSDDILFSYTLNE